MKIEQLTCAVGAELIDVNLGDAVRDALDPRSRNV